MPKGDFQILLSSLLFLYSKYRIYKISAEVPFIHAEQISLHNFIILRKKTIGIAED